MQLDIYLLRTKTSSRDFSKKLKVSIHAVNKWRQRIRIPRRASMAKIQKFTNGKVTPKDWY